MSNFHCVFTQYTVSNPYGKILRQYLRLKYKENCVMKRDMNLVRKILFYIEECHVDVALNSLMIEGYDMKVVAYHCEIMYQANLVKDYKPVFGGDELLFFNVGGLTWNGQEYLELIRSDKIWNETIKKVDDEKLPKNISTIAKIAGKFAGGVISGMS
jgi:hypothetical protein